MLYNKLIDMIGKTPVIKLENPDVKKYADVYVKLESYNIGGSVKDRAALGMVLAAIEDGLLKPGGTIIEPTSGNTGISLAVIAAKFGYELIIVMPDSMSIERRKIMESYGAKLVLTDGNTGMKGSIEEAERILYENKDYFMPQQFNNPANPKIHYETTGKEIIEDIPDMDAFVCGVGTGGTLSGTGKRLKEYNKDIRIVAVEPAASPVISGGKPGKHKIQGIGAGFVPKNLNLDIVDKVITVTDDEAFKAWKITTLKNSLFLGISSGANISAAYKLAEELGAGKKVVTISPDSGEKYLSTDLFKK